MNIWEIWSIYDEKRLAFMDIGGDNERELCFLRG
jgi:hypothetical protein